MDVATGLVCEMKYKIRKPPGSTSGLGEEVGGRISDISFAEEMIDDALDGCGRTAHV